MPGKPQIERKLAAIMFTDIAGYTESMSKSESKSLDTLEKKRSILKPLLKEHKGTFVKEIGDGTLSYFESAVNAATCAVKLQETTYDDKDMNIRVGIHIGDIVFKDGDVFGGGVNVASRLESIAPAGGVCVSKSVYDELSNQDEFDGIELGLQSLKGVGRLIEVFGLKGEKLNEPDPQKYQENKVAVHTDDEVPSIAIIPFDNKGADEDVFYAYGISADLISDCSSAGLIRVASLKNIENLDYNLLDTNELANKLLVRYIATGTLWKMDDMAQLFEAFLYNFYKKEFKGEYNVSRPILKWNAQPIEDDSMDYLPDMRTDIFLDSPKEKIIIDAKYYGNSLQTNFNKKTIHSGHLYQIYAYLKNIQIRGSDYNNCKGMIIYPTTDEELSISNYIDGHQITIKTINLNQPWKEIDKSLREMLN